MHLFGPSIHLYIPTFVADIITHLVGFISILKGIATRRGDPLWFCKGYFVIGPLNKWAFDCNGLNSLVYYFEIC
jgi:hypothetical protein